MSGFDINHNYWIAKAVFTGEKSKDDHNIVVTGFGARLQYSEHNRIPDVGETVIGCNNFGKCIVKGYFMEDGFFGVLMTPVKPPVWFKKQEKAREKEKKGGPIGVGNIGLFGAEFEYPEAYKARVKARKAAEKKAGVNTK